MASSIVVNYVGGVIIGKNKGFGKKIALVISLVLNLSLLFVFKYLDFAISILNMLPHLNMKKYGILLPIGISFFTFQGMSYLIDVYREDVPYQKSLLKLGLYISLFPQLIAGPIVRYSSIQKEIDDRHTSLNDFSEGMTRFIFGLAKKVLLANRLAEVVDEIFKIPAAQNTCAVAWIGVLFYSLQLYFDFSGYSDMAIGLGRVFGFHFNENFNYPYLSKSISEFWRRWHISLSSWFKDYLYIPLGGNRNGNVYVNLFIVFICTGIWHGAALNFVFWGIWHGIFIIAERFIKKYLNLNYTNLWGGAIQTLQFMYTMLVVLVGWLFFRADTMEYAVTTLKIMFGFLKTENPLFSAAWYLNNFSIFIFAIGVFIAFNGYGLYTKVAFTLRKNFAYQIATRILVLCLLLLSCVFVITSTYNPFIYFRF